jgi:hypothetical protein
MKCEHVYKNGSPCKGNAVRGLNLCDVHGFRVRYFIKLTWQAQPGDHWTKRQKAVWPVLFDTTEQALDHLRSVDVYRNLHGRRKLTAAVEPTRKRFAVRHLARVQGAAE